MSADRGHLRAMRLLPFPAAVLLTLNRQSVAGFTVISPHSVSEPGSARARARHPSSSLSAGPGQIRSQLAPKSDIGGVVGGYQDHA